jgi:DNA-binding transcriptional LysR family regulator
MNMVNDEALDLRDLRYFAACCAEGGLTAAARRLNVGQPTLSHAMARLERRLGESLLERPANRRAGLRPTAAGKLLLARARLIEVQLSGVHDDLAALRGVVRGELTIGSIQSLNATLLPRPLARFAAAHPGIALTLRTIASDEVPGAVRDGRFDLGFLAMPAVRDFPGVELTTVAREAFVVIVRADDPLAGEAKLPLKRLADRPLVLVPADTLTGSIIHRACRQAGFTPRPVLSLESGEALRETVRAGLGCTILPEGYLPPADPELRAIRLVDPTPRREVVAATRSEVPLSRAAAAFLVAVRGR